MSKSRDTGKRATMGKKGSVQEIVVEPPPPIEHLLALPLPDPDGPGAFRWGKLSDHSSELDLDLSAIDSDATA
jgi:hypothetical protein